MFICTEWLLMPGSNRVFVSGLQSSILKSYNQEDFSKLSEIRMNIILVISPINFVFGSILLICFIGFNSLTISVDLRIKFQTSPSLFSLFSPPLVSSHMFSFCFSVGPWILPCSCGFFFAVCMALACRRPQTLSGTACLTFGSPLAADRWEPQHVLLCCDPSVVCSFVHVCMSLTPCCFLGSHRGLECTNVINKTLVCSCSWPSF